MYKPITPLIAADIIIELVDFPDRPIVLRPLHDGSLLVQ